jgi:iron-sulfur cluster assembly protein
VITKEMTIEDILNSFPQKSQKIAQVLADEGLQCAGCCASAWETLEAGLLGHDRTQEEIDAIVTKLNQVIEEPMEETSIAMTEAAATKFKEFAGSQEDVKALRFGDKPAGCSGFEYVLEFSKEAKEDDEVFHSQGIEIHVKKSQLPRLMGCTIDYADGLSSSGFKIINPNAKSSCGCGSSHGY